MTAPIYSIVIPVFNSALILPHLNNALINSIEQTQKAYEIIYVDDHSTDNTWEVLIDLANSFPRVRIIRLASNSGQWMALHCGTSKALGDHVIHMDDDMEYNPKDILKLLARYHSENLIIVYGIPKEKSQKDTSNKLFYHIRSKLLDIFLAKHKTESFRVFDKNYIDSRSSYLERGLHFEAMAKRIVPQDLVGYVNVSYGSRLHGRSGYRLLKKIKLIARYGPEYILHPFFSLVALGIFNIILIYTFIGTIGVENTVYSWLALPALTVMILITAIILITQMIYIVRSRFILKGQPDYDILDEK